MVEILIIVVLALSIVAPLFVGLAIYYLIATAAMVLQSLAIFRLAKRRGVPHAWTAWVPYVSYWTMAELSDRYQTCLGKKGFRMPLIMQIAVLVVAALYIISNAFSWIGFVFLFSISAVYYVFLLLSIVVSVIALPAWILITVLNYIAMFDVYKSCQPSTAVLYLVLSIVCPFLAPVFLLLVHKKDLGMPVAEPAPVQ